jgi:hypothetical protein
MLRPLGPGKLALEGMRFLPPILSPLIDAGKRGEPLESVVTAIVRMFGFDTFMYATSLSPRRGQEAVSYVFTTLPREWVARYDQQAYIEIDPRVVCTFESALPFVWDQKSERGKSAAVDDTSTTRPPTAWRAVFRSSSIHPSAVTSSSHLIRSGPKSTRCGASRSRGTWATCCSSVSTFTKSS